MSIDQTSAAAQPGREIPYACLKVLARAGSHARIAESEAGGESGPSIEIVARVGAEPVVVRKMTRARLDALVAAGLLERMSGAQPRWHITAAGRAVLAARRSPVSPDGLAPRPDRAAIDGATSTLPRVNDAESPLAWLARRKSKDGKPLLTQPQVDAGERLRADFYFAGMTPRVTVNWNAFGGAGAASKGAGRGGAIDRADAAVAAEQRVRRALAAVGPELAGILVDVCGHLIGLEDAETRHGFPPRAGKVVLQLALTSLARHYGYVRDIAPRAQNAASSIRHWGEEGYRPTLDLWQD